MLGVGLAILRFEVALEGALDMFPLKPSRGVAGNPLNDGVLTDEGGFFASVSHTDG